MTGRPAWLVAFLADESLPETYARTVDLAVLPLAERVAALPHPVTVGVCGAQASGKSTLCAAIARALEARGLRVAVLSIDDLYLQREARQALARHVHPLLATRGPPGTHDVALGHAVLDSLRRPGRTALPRFDKARDTRKPRAAWDEVEGPVDVVLFEGWCVGARPQVVDALIDPVNELERLEDPEGLWRTYVNDALAGPYQALFARQDQLVLLRPPGFEVVLKWRIEQEHKLKARLKASDESLARTQSDAAIARFVAHYERLTRHILKEMPTRADVVIGLDATRAITGVTGL